MKLTWIPLASALWIGASAQAADSINIAYFLEWPTPNLIAKAEGRFDEAFDIPLRWTAFDTGTQMTEAMIAGVIDIAYSQGLAPFVSAISDDVPITMVAVAAQYPANDCVVRSDGPIDRTQPETLVGQRVALPLATMADYSFRQQLQALGIDPSSMQVIDRIPADAAVALVDGEVDMACGFGALAMSKMYEVGEALMDAEEKAQADISAFDVVSVRDEFLRENPELVELFLSITDTANLSYQGSPEEIEVLGLESGMDPGGVATHLEEFAFPSAALQQDALFGSDSSVLDAMRVVGRAFAEEGAPVRTDYDAVVNTRLLQ